MGGSPKIEPIQRVLWPSVLLPCASVLMFLIFLGAAQRLHRAA
jgi:hypothetical protein